jgi:plasmid stabilization system protein ParE
MQVSWTPRALKSYFNIADYLHIELGLNSVRSFILKVEKTIRSVSENPEMFPVSVSFKNVRKAKVSRHTTIFYRINPRKKEIILLLFWDNRQKPQKRNL